MSAHSACLRTREGAEEPYQQQCDQMGTRETSPLEAAILISCRRREVSRCQRVLAEASPRYGPRQDLSDIEAECRMCLWRWLKTGRRQRRPREGGQWYRWAESSPTF